MRGKQRRAAREGKHEIAARGRAITRRFKNEGVARGGAGRRVVVDRKLEGPEMALGVEDRSFDDWEGCDGRRRDLRRPSDNDGDIKMIQHSPGFDRTLVSTID